MGGKDCPKYGGLLRLLLLLLLRSPFFSPERTWIDEQAEGASLSLSHPDIFPFLLPLVLTGKCPRQWSVGGLLALSLLLSLSYALQRNRKRGHGGEMEKKVGAFFLLLFLFPFVHAETLPPPPFFGRRRTQPNTQCATT